MCMIMSISIPQVSLSNMKARGNKKTTQSKKQEKRQLGGGWDKGFYIIFVRG